MEVKDWPARMPLSILIVEPELPESRVTGSVEGEYPLNPDPMIVIVSRSRRTGMPNRDMQSRVDSQSALCANPLMMQLPDAADANNATRCEIDLSPGISMLPTSGRGPVTDMLSDMLKFLDMATFAMLHKSAQRGHYASELARTDGAQEAWHAKGAAHPDVGTDQGKH
jgi:hypothetical protein